jgi:hypothetical protein
LQAKVLQGLEMSRRPQGRHLHRAISSQPRRKSPDEEETCEEENLLIS